VSLFISIAVGGATYLVVLPATGGLTEEDLRIVPSRIRKYIKVRHKKD